MKFIIIDGTIDGRMFINMVNIKTIHTGEEQNHYCIYLDREAIPFYDKEKRDKALENILGFVGYR
jgi:hypothetical protein